MQCPIDRTPHTMAFDNSVMVTLRKRPVSPSPHWDSNPQPSDCEALMEPRRHWDAPRNMETIMVPHSKHRGTITQLMCEMHIHIDQRCDSFQTHFAQCCYLVMSRQIACSTIFQCKINTTNGDATKEKIKEHQKNKCTLNFGRYMKKIDFYNSNVSHVFLC